MYHLLPHVHYSIHKRYLNINTKNDIVLNLDFANFEILRFIFNFDRKTFKIECT